MRLLVACEYSATVREAFAAKGWDAWSCDLLPSDLPGKHYQCSALDVIDLGWDLLIAFPPCTYLTYAGMANWYDEGRAEKRIKAAEFFMQMYNAPISHVCVENPRGIMSQLFRKPDMEIHPWYFGDREMKRTNLWLKNLPPLEYHLQENLFGQKTATDKPEPVSIDVRKKTGKRKVRYWHDAVFKESKNGRYFPTGHERSKTFSGIANAMADQWTKYLIK